LNEESTVIHQRLHPTPEDMTVLQRPLDRPPYGLLKDLLFALGISDCGLWVDFWPDAISAFLEKTGVDRLSRPRQSVLHGFEFPFEAQTVLTLFRACEFLPSKQSRGDGEGGRWRRRRYTNTNFRSIAAWKSAIT
jgi:hypothetical protein